MLLSGAEFVAGFVTAYNVVDHADRGEREEGDAEYVRCAMMFDVKRSTACQLAGLYTC